MMADYLLIGSCDPFESNDVMRLYALAENLVKNGSRVTLFLVQNGVLSARENAQSGALSAVAGNGVEILADEFSLRERGISPDGLVSGVSAAALDVVVDQLADGRKAIWH
jgi:sulfur relay (sulfurtransferase) complex TusBCD TusD component (DsrE family)